MATRDHGGNLSAAIAQYGGCFNDWIDLSTGINPSPFPIPKLSPQDWSQLPDQAAVDALLAAARSFWNVPDEAEITAAPGASALIAALPSTWTRGTVQITTPTYNEHAGAFEQAGWNVQEDPGADVQVIVHPNNPDGRHWRADALNAPIRIIDESFCDVCPEQSMIAQAACPGTVVLKSFGKFWGLAGLRLGFAIGAPDIIANLRSKLGPWAVSGPALTIGTAALNNNGWATETRLQLRDGSERLDRIVTAHGARIVGGTDLFRLYEVEDCNALQEHLAHHRIWSRIFPYSSRYIRLGLPPADRWAQLERAFA